MKDADLDVSIDEVVVDGFRRNERPRVSAAVADEVARALRARGVPETRAREAATAAGEAVAREAER